METVALARQAMATRFEMLLHGENAVALRAAAEEALDEVERLEAQLSLYRRTSEISRLNSRAAAGPVRVEPGLFRLLQQAKSLSRESGGAFDITVAPLLRCWGFMAGSGELPDPEAWAEARSKVGMDLLILRAEDFSVQFAREGMMLDLGAIGKGYALERAAEILIEAGVTSALLHGGTSTICAIGAPPGAEGWKIAIEHSNYAPPNFETGADANRRDQAESVLATVLLKDGALSVSAVWGKSFEANGKVYGHVIDPRTGAPAEGAVLAAVVLPSATETDALSTALLTLGLDGHGRIADLRPGMRTLVAARTPNSDQLRVVTRGIQVSWTAFSPGQS